MTDHLITEYRSRLPATHLARLCGAVRTSYYRRATKPAGRFTGARRDDRSLVHRLHETCATETGFGYRRITLELHKQGWNVNHKRVLRLMRQEKLLWKPRPRFTVPTSDSGHALKIYPYLVEDLVVRRPNQLWVSDITYVHCGRDRFGYLAVVLDAYSRRCLGWSFERYLDTRLTLQALKQALAYREPPSFHHSDRGMQYASGEYTGVLKAHHIRISMSRSGNPYDNAKAESFFKTLKTEEVHLKDYGSLEEAETGIRQYIDTRYNQRRMHSSLGYATPKAYEAAYHQHKNRSLGARETVSP